MTTTSTALLTIALWAASGLAAAQSTADRQPNESFKDCPECPEMVTLPAGAFVMGGRETKREQPPRLVRILAPIAMGKFEVTFDEWKACFNAGACAEIPGDHGWGRGARPVVNINFHMASGYVRWLSRKTGRRYRLPTEAEWEYAARAGSTTRFWFGDKAGVGRLNCRDCGTKWSKKKTAPVGSFRANPFGLHDMHGNAYEWVEDCWVDNYRGAPKDGSARLDGDCSQRVIRGGSWYYFQRQSRSASRAKNPVNVKSYWLSFRVVRDMP